MTNTEAYLIGLLVNAVEKHRKGCDCAPCRVVYWINVNSPELKKIEFSDLMKATLK